MNYLSKIIRAIFFLACVYTCTSNAQEIPKTSVLDAGAIDEEYRDILRDIDNHQYDQALVRLRSLINKEPDHAGAWLDMAILFCYLGEPEQASQLFNTIKNRFDLPDVMQEIIRDYQLSGCKKPEAPPSFRFRVASGVDSNPRQGVRSTLVSIGDLNLELDPSYVARSSSFYELGADWLYRTPQGIFYTQMGARDYASASEMNQVSMSAGYVQNLAFSSELSAQLKAVVGSLWLDGRSLQYVTGLSLDLSYENWELSQHLWYQNYVRDRGFDTISLETQLQHYFVHSPVSRSYIGGGFIYDMDRSDKRPGGDRHGYRLVGGHHYRWDQWGLNTDVSYTHWRSDHLFSPGLINFKRDNQGWMFNSELVYEIDTSQAVHLNYRFQRARDDIHLYDFDSHAVWMTWTYLR